MYNNNQLAYSIVHYIKPRESNSGKKTVGMLPLVLNYLEICYTKLWLKLCQNAVNFLQVIQVQKTHGPPTALETQITWKSSSQN